MRGRGVLEAVKRRGPVIQTAIFVVGRRRGAVVVVAEVEGRRGLELALPLQFLRQREVGLALLGDVRKRLLRRRTLERALRDGRPERVVRFRFVHWRQDFDPDLMLLHVCDGGRECVYSGDAESFLRVAVEQRAEEVNEARVLKMIRKIQSSLEDGGGNVVGAVGRRLAGHELIEHDCGGPDVARGAVRLAPSHFGRPVFIAATSGAVQRLTTVDAKVAARRLRSVRQVQQSHAPLVDIHQ
mmetsp:Transcript_28554/g.96148  ORF Transcript_28554/g.96148 Transcript_28554/m.96148 type:complete len:241 (-) Transcript_28554:1684-2406(-)